MTTSFAGSRAVVTGAGGGMGRELAVQLAREGASGVAICDVRTDELAQTKALCVAAGTSASLVVTAHTVDVTSAEAVARFCDEVRAAHGDVLEVLINNAGIATSGSFADMPAARFDRTFDVSWRGTLLMTRAFLPMVLAAKPARAWIVNLSSINAFWNCLGPARWPLPTPPHAPYCAAKAAVRAFSESLLFDAKQNFPHVQVVAVHPGHVGTDIARLAEKAEGAQALERMRNAAKLHGITGGERMGAAELTEAFGVAFRDAAPTSAAEAAAQILGGMRSGSTRVLVGEDAVVVDWLCRLFPRLVYDDWFIVGVMWPWIRVAQLVGRPAGLPLGRFALPSLFALLARRVAGGRLQLKGGARL
eukprot:g6078.t1